MKSIDSDSQWIATHAPRSTPLPSAAQRLLLEAALGDGEAAVAAAREWSLLVDLDRIDFGSFRLLPLLVRNLERLDIELPSSDRLRGIYRRCWYRNQVLLRGAKAALGVLRDAGVETLVIKGAALIDRYYPDSGTRPMSDVDILVGSADRDSAFSILEASGWELIRPTVRIETRHAVEFINADHGGMVDLHWASSARDFHPKFDETALFERASPATLLEGVSILAPEDELLLAVRHGIPQGRISWIADVAFIVRNGKVDWLALQDASARYRTAELLETSLRWVADVTGVPIHETVLQALTASSRPRWHRREVRTLLRPSGSLRLRQTAEAWYRYRRWCSNGGIRANPMRFPAHWSAVLGLRGTRGLLAHAARVSRLGSRFSR